MWECNCPNFDLLGASLWWANVFFFCILADGGKENATVPINKLAFSSPWSVFRWPAVLHAYCDNQFFLLLSLSSLQQGDYFSNSTVDPTIVCDAPQVVTEIVLSNPQVIEVMFLNISSIIFTKNQEFGIKKACLCENAPCCYLFCVIEGIFSGR